MDKGWRLLRFSSKVSALIRTVVRSDKILVCYGCWGSYIVLRICFVYIYMCIFSTGGSVLDSFVIFTPVLLKIA